MQRSAVVACCVLESVLWGQVNAVRRPTVEGAIRLIVVDCRAGILQNMLGRFDHVEYRPLIRGPFGNAFNLLCVEDGVHAMNESISATRVRLVGGFVSIAVTGTNWFRSRVASGFHLPELNLRALLSLANLPRQRSCLPVRHPAGITVSATEAHRHEVDRVATAVCFACRWIHRYVERGIGGIPRFLPRSHPVLKHFDDAIGDLLPEIPSGRLRWLADRNLAWIH